MWPGVHAHPAGESLAPPSRSRSRRYSPTFDASRFTRIEIGIRSAHATTLSRTTSKVPSTVTERPHLVVYLRGSVERDLHPVDPERLQPTGDLGCQQVAVGDDRRGVRHLARPGPLEEGLRKPVDAIRSEQGLAAVPGHVEPLDRRQLCVHHLEQEPLGLLIEDGGRLVLEAVRTVEVATQAGDDGEREGRTVGGSGPEPSLENGELVRVVVDEHPRQREIAEGLHRRHPCVVAADERQRVRPVGSGQRDRPT